MRYSQLFGKTIKSAPSEELSINAQYLIQAGFIDKLMAGSYTLLPLGFRVKEKIEQIIREEMNKTGAEEMLMPLLHPKEIWNETGRWESAKDVMYQFEKNDRDYALSFTHEEIALDIVRKHLRSYKDLPVKIYQFSTKFRNELRAKSGILRGREFIMKDMYSLHDTKEELYSYYFVVAQAYEQTFKRMGLNVVVVESGGGVFTDSNSHELQLVADIGEDTIYYCESCNLWQNEEIITDGGCSSCGKKLGHGKRSIEVGNIFRFEQMYSKKMNITFTDKNGEQKYPFFGSYGIGITRLIGAIVEVMHDEKGIIWPESVAPYQVQLVGIFNQDTDVKNRADKLYETLKKHGVEVLYDDRETVSAGQKFADADLIGLPYRLVVSSKTSDQIEVKKRDEKETGFMSVEQVLRRLGQRG